MTATIVFIQIKPHYMVPFVVLSLIILIIYVFVVALDILRHVGIPLDRKMILSEMILNLSCVVYVQGVLKQQIFS